MKELSIEEKSLLLKDLCARFHYDVKVLEDIDKEFDGGCIAELVTITEIKGEKMFLVKNSLTPVTIEEIRPYLRPMSSMTEEEINEFILISDTVLWLGDKRSTCILSLEQMDWLNAHYFDYRGLIKRGLALEAPEGMYNLKEK